MCNTNRFWNLENEWEDPISKCLGIHLLRCNVFLSPPFPQYKALLFFVEVERCTRNTLCRRRCCWGTECRTNHSNRTQLFKKLKDNEYMFQKYHIFYFNSNGLLKILSLTTFVFPTEGFRRRAFLIRSALCNTNNL